MDEAIAAFPITTTKLPFDNCCRYFNVVVKPAWCAYAGVTGYAEHASRHRQRGYALCDSAVAGLAALATQLLRTIGAVVPIDDEALMDAVTAVSGSGPAMCF